MLHTVAVSGGTLAVETTPGFDSRPPGSLPVLAVHGISSTRRLWDWLLAADPTLPLVTVDLRGRGDSHGVGATPGHPAGLDGHVADCRAVLAHLGLLRAHLLGMSMGGFVVAELARGAPQLAASVLLVDGGPPAPAPPGLTVDTVGLAFSDRLGRLAKVWPSVGDYAAYFTASTAPLLDAQDPLLRAYLTHDLTEGAAGGQVRLDGDALVRDATDVFFGPDRTTGITAPVRLLLAAWSGGADTPPMYSDDAAAAAVAGLPTLQHVARVPGVDHAAIIMSPQGATAVAGQLRAALAAPAAPADEHAGAPGVRVPA